MSDQSILRARFQAKTGNLPAVDVHFNPASLQYQITNTLDRQGSGNSSKQYVSQSTGKLTMDLVFDTTATGEDVRVHTGKLAKLMEPVPEGRNRNVPAVVEFMWGSYSFQGVVESYKETFDFFASTGIPLRASVNLTLASQDKVFEEATGPKVDTAGGLTPEPVIVPAAGRGASDVASAAGNPGAARALAAANGQESLRFSASASLAVSGGVDLRGPVAFAGGGAGLSLGASGGIGLSAGAGAGLSAGIGLSAGAGASAGIGIGAGAGASGGLSGGFGFGASASAGVGASAGAFAGLRASTQGAAKLDTSRLLQASASAGIGTDRGAAFAPGGRAKLTGPTSLRADVGAQASLSTRLRFEE
jgi:hypothetical protein